MTEKEKRKIDDLVTLDDYLNMITILDETAGNTGNNESLDKSIILVGKALKKKVAYILRRSRKYRKPQSMFSIMKESWATWRESRREKRDERLAAVAAKKREGAMLSLKASPEANQSQLEFEEKSTDSAVAEKDNEIENTDEDVLDF